MSSKPLDTVSVKNRLVDITLKLIDEQGGLQGLTFREIARQAGCAHTNIYNYFSSFDGLLFAALKAILDRLVLFTQSRIKPDKVKEPDYLKIFLTAQIDFALEHPGWYHFIWLDNLDNLKSEPEIGKLFEFFESSFIEKIFYFGKGKLDKKEAAEAGDLVHGLLHGEICKLIGGRFLNIDKEEYRQRIVANCHKLLAFVMSQKGKR